jgi:hypothetical protein
MNKKLAIFNSIYSHLCPYVHIYICRKQNDHKIGFREKCQLFRRKLVENTENFWKLYKIVGNRLKYIVLITLTPAATAHKIGFREKCQLFRRKLVENTENFWK